MKKITKSFISLLVVLSLMLAQIYEISGADAGNAVLVPIANYTLNRTAVDSTGIQSNITLKNAPYQSDGSVYSNGIYPYPDASTGSTIETPMLSSFDFNNFRVSVNFKITSLPSRRSPIIIGGSSYRWIGANIEPNGTVSLLWNNYNITYSSKYVSVGSFYNITISYNGALYQRCFGMFTSLYINKRKRCQLP